MTVDDGGPTPRTFVAVTFILYAVPGVRSANVNISGDSAADTVNGPSTDNDDAHNAHSVYACKGSELVTTGGSQLSVIEVLCRQRQRGDKSETTASLTSQIRCFGNADCGSLSTPPHLVVTTTCRACGGPGGAW